MLWITFCKIQFKTERLPCITCGTDIGKSNVRKSAFVET